MGLLLRILLLSLLLLIPLFIVIIITLFHSPFPNGGIMKTLLIALATVVFRAMMKAASPLIRKFITEKIEDIRLKAAETPNKWDDILAEALHDVLIGDE